MRFVSVSGKCVRYREIRRHYARSQTVCMCVFVTPFQCLVWWNGIVMGEFEELLGITGRNRYDMYEGISQVSMV